MCLLCVWWDARRLVLVVDWRLCLLGSGCDCGLLSAGFPVALTRLFVRLRFGIKIILAIRSLSSSVALRVCEQRCDWAND